ncbi:MAG: DUF3298 domain-containing protein [Flavobacteriaceae bacterium]|nr:DUF3298 domain-containing protein [Flavobacteriaceae bacterium]
MKSVIYVFLAVFLLGSCTTKTPLIFIDSNALYEDNAVIEINIPMAQGNSELAKVINSKIENHVANMLSFAEELSDTITLKDAITIFDTTYTRFKTDVSETALVWEATFNGEVTRNSNRIISIAISSYSNTGGAHGHTNVSFFNFDKTSSKLIDINTIISNKDRFKTLAQKHFRANISREAEFSYDDYFFEDSFLLPANIGFNDDGLILFYNPYEIAPYAMGITEFTIPYDELDAIIALN